MPSEGKALTYEINLIKISIYVFDSSALRFRLIKGHGYDIHDKY